MTVRVVLVDDEAMVRVGLRMVLSSEPDIEVSQVTENTATIIAYFASCALSAPVPEAAAGDPDAFPGWRP